MKYYFTIKISQEEFLPYYQGKVQNVQVTTVEGIKVQFPAMHLRKYLTSLGVQGYFCLETQDNKFLALHKMN